MEAKPFVLFTRCRISICEAARCTRTQAKITGTLTVLLLLLLILAGRISAQPEIWATSAYASGSQVDVRFHVRCNGGYLQQLSMQNMRIRDNGQDLTASSTLQCLGVGALSAALVFDASGSMSGMGNAIAKQAGHRFIDSLDGIIDEATVIWFNTMVNIQQQMTTIKPLLYGAVNALPASGGTAVWDGTYAGLIELINNGVHSTRAVIVLTDGVDASSSRTSAEVIDLALRNRIRVFNVLLGHVGNAFELRMIADRTNGGFYQCDDATEVLAAYEEIYRDIRASVHDCILSYTGACPDGREHWINLGVQQVCGGDDTTNIAYTALYDSTVAQEVHMSFGGVAVNAEAGTVKVPLNLDAPINTGIFRSCFINMRYDTSYLSFRSARIPPGSLIEGVTLNVTEFPSKSVNLETMSDKLVSGTGTLLEAEFDVKSVFDTTCARIWARTARFERTCNFPGIDTGLVCITPGIPPEGCTMDWPRSIVWDENLNAYVPNPFVVRMRAYNTGSTALRNARYRITADTSVMTLVSPQSDVQLGSPSDIPPDTWQEVQWELHTRPQTSPATLPIRIVASFDNHADITCQGHIQVSAAEAGVYCSIVTPTIVRDPHTGFYAPTPFPVTVTVDNSGGITSDTLLAEINIPPDLEFAAPDSPATARKQLNPAVLPPGQIATVQWMLRPRRAEMYNRVLTIRTVVEHRGGEPLDCSRDLTLPPWIAPAFSTTLQQPHGHNFCEGEWIRLEAEQGFADYLWSTGDTTDFLIVRESGAYYCMVWDSLGRLGRSDTVVATKHPLPRPTLMVFGQNPLCFGDSLQLTPGGDYAAYIWNTGKTESTLTVKSAGTYFVRVTDTYGCMGYSDTLTVTILPPPVKPVITREGDVLRTGMYPQYQWYRDGTLLDGATTDSLLLQKTGSYTVLVTGDNGCSNMSDPLVVSVLGIEPAYATDLDVLLYPNPAQDAVLLRTDLRRAGILRITLIDMLGRTARHMERAAGPGITRESIDLNGLAPGMYLLRLSAGGRHASRTLLVLRH